MLICLLMNASQSSWQFCLILDTAILTWIELLFLGEEEKKQRQGLGTRGRPRTLSGVAKSKRGFLRGGKGHSVLLDWTGLMSPRLVPPLSYQLPSLCNYTPDGTHYEMCPNLTRYSCHITGLSICTSSFQCTINYFIPLLKSALFS